MVVIVKQNLLASGDLIHPFFFFCDFIQSGFFFSLKCRILLHSCLKIERKKWVLRLVSIEARYVMHLVEKMSP